MSKRADEARAQIVDAALTHFASRGYAGTSVQRIADEVGISKQLVLYHFQSKEAIQRAVLEDVITMWKEALPRVIGSAVGDEGSLEAGIENLIDVCESHPRQVRFILRELLDEDSAAFGILAERINPWMSMSTSMMPATSSALEPQAVAELFGITMTSLFALFPEGRSPPERYQKRRDALKAIIRLVVHEIIETNRSATL